MWLRIQHYQIWIIPVILALFISRVLSELWSLLTQTSISWLGLIAIIVPVHSLVLLLLHRSKVSLGWPYVLLFLYVVFPEQAVHIATGVLLLTLTAVILSRPTKIRNQTFLFSLLITVGFGILYAITLAPDLLPADNGEFQLVATTLGVAHPPGFPLYTMLAYLVSLLPLGASSGLMINLFSLFTSVLTLFVLYHIVHLLTSTHVAAITAVIALGSATTFWAQATTANIRSLTGLFAALFIYTLLRFEQLVRPQLKLGASSGTIKSSANKDRCLILATLTISFGITHHPSLLFIGVVGGLFVALVDSKLILTPRRWKRPLLFGLLGLLPLLYLPLRAGSDAPGATARLATWDGFLDHVLARGFSGDLFYFTTPDLLWQRFKVMENVMNFQFSPVLLWGMGMGLLLLLWHNWRLAFLLCGAFGLHTFITATYRAPQTVEYMLPAYIPAVILLGFGIGKLKSALQAMPQLTKRPAFVNRLTRLATAVFLLTAVHQTIRHYPSYAAIHASTNTRDYVQTIFANAPKDAVILADWHWFSPLRILQQVESQRPDLSIKFVPPADKKYADTWARRIDEELANGRFVIATHFESKAYEQLPPPEPIGEAYLFRQQPRHQLPDQFTKAVTQLNETIQIKGFQLSTPTVEQSEEAILTVGWKPENDIPTSLFVHLIGVDGRLYAQDDLTIIPQPEGITLTRFRLTPRPGALPGDYAIMLGNGENRAQITTLTVIPMTRPPVTQQPVWRTIATVKEPFRRLIGYDWDHTLAAQTRLYLHWQTSDGYVTEVKDNEAVASLDRLKTIGAWGIEQNLGNTIQPKPNQHYVPLGQGIVWTGGGLDENVRLEGEQALSIQPTFISSQPVLRDLAVSVRLIGYQPDGVQWAWWDLADSIPAMGAIPTLKWIHGSEIRSPHFTTINAAATPDQTIGATLLLYDAFTNQPLTILDERITAQFPWIPLRTNE